MIRKCYSSAFYSVFTETWATESNMTTNQMAELNRIQLMNWAWQLIDKGHCRRVCITTDKLRFHCLVVDNRQAGFELNRTFDWLVLRMLESIVSFQSLGGPGFSNCPVSPLKTCYRNNFYVSTSSPFFTQIFI